MINYQFRFEVEDKKQLEQQYYRKMKEIDPAYGFFQQQKQLKQHLKSTQQNNRFELRDNGQQSLKKKIRKNIKVKKSVPQVNMHLKGLLEQFINESMQQANKGFVFRQLQNCQEIKSTIDKMERILIGMKSLLLSQMINCQCQD
ncbi:unnamed protein product [Paramecium sonneborni]|uniref:Uncharacterized protein n=1 Tax=Paramecium sonneborni TaxID=65129 RepID=A0A8S1K638_9CILI|nr:unnamed protein product [Paramecium sonneborni]